MPVGANPLAAQSSGVKVLRYQIEAYVVAAACYAIAGVLLAGFVRYASPTAGSDYLLPSIAAVVVGGTPFTGGRGSVVAVEPQRCLCPSWDRCFSPLVLAPRSRCWFRRLRSSRQSRFGAFRSNCLPLKQKPRTKERSSKDNLSNAANLMR